MIQIHTAGTAVDRVLLCETGGKEASSHTIVRAMDESLP